jgi:2-dehydropantoate 2-reductase
MIKRIAIVGAGAIGSALGGLLQRAGHEVLLVGRRAHVNAIRDAGLRVSGVLGSFSVNVEAAEALASRPDVAFLTVKSQDVLTALQANRALLQDVPLVTFQNGVRSDELAASVLPKQRIASAVISFHANYLNAGEVTLLYAGPLVLGRPFAPNDAEVNEIASILRDAFPTSISGNIQGAHWLKLLVNINNAFPALTNLTFSEIYRDACLGKLAVRAMREGMRIVEGAGIVLESLPDIPMMLVRATRLLPLPLAVRIAAAKIKKMESGGPLLGSTLQSLRRRQPTEIDYLNAEVVRLGRAAELPTPLNTAIVELVHQVEKSGRFFSTEAIRGAMELAERDSRSPRRV